MVIFGSFTDARDNQVYKTIDIGTQTWMAENLMWLPSVNVKADYSDIEAKYYVYGFDETSVATAKTMDYYSTYGTLYNYIAALSACPTGWHLPTDEEWQALEVYLGMSSEEAATPSWRGTDEGDQLKANSPLWGLYMGSNTSGYSALPGGFYYSGQFYNHGIEAYFWTATANGATSSAWFRSLNSEMLSTRLNMTNNSGFSIRCLKDSN